MRRGERAVLTRVQDMTSRAGRSWAPAFVAERTRRLDRWLSTGDRGVLLSLAVLTVAGVGAMLTWEIVTGIVLMVPLLIGGLLLSPRRVPWAVVMAMAGLIGVTLIQLDDGVPEMRWVTAAVATVMSAVILASSYQRAVLGVAGVRGDSMLIDLRERLTRQGALPPLPAGWYAEEASRSADAASFAGDFMVTQMAEDGRRLGVAVVDVSGKGVDAGTRSLLLSGAFGGLLGALPGEGFLPAANRFLLMQGWSEGFATAVHLDVDLVTGVFELRSAGHPPAVQFVSGSGRWLVHEGIEGPVLGLVPDARFGVVRGELAPGDALLLYTDGLVEERGRDISLGIDRLIGQGEHLVRSNFEGSAQSLVHRLGASDDDCALLMIQRR